MQCDLVRELEDVVADFAEIGDCYCTRTISSQLPSCGSPMITKYQPEIKYLYQDYTNARGVSRFRKHRDKVKKGKSLRALEFSDPSS